MVKIKYHRSLEYLVKISNYHNLVHGNIFLPSILHDHIEI